MARFRKKFSTLCSLLNWLHHPVVLESSDFFVSRSFFSRLCRVLNVSEGAEFSSATCLLANHRVAYKKFWSEGEECLWNSFPHSCAGGCWKCTRVLNSAPYVGCWIQQAAEGAEFLSEMGHRLIENTGCGDFAYTHIKIYGSIANQYFFQISFLSLTIEKS